MNKLSIISQIVSYKALFLRHSIIHNVDILICLNQLTNSLLITPVQKYDRLIDDLDKQNFDTNNIFLSICSWPETVESDDISTEFISRFQFIFPIAMIRKQRPKLTERRHLQFGQTL